LVRDKSPPVTRIGLIYFCSNRVSVIRSRLIVVAFGNRRIQKIMNDIASALSPFSLSVGQSQQTKSGSSPRPEPPRVDQEVEAAGDVSTYGLANPEGVTTNHCRC